MAALQVRALFRPNVACIVRGKSGVFGGYALRISISVVVIASALAGSLGSAAAQYYPPPPAAYPPPPPGAYYPPPGASPPPYDARYDRPGIPGEDPGAYPPAGRPYFAPQPMAYGDDQR